MTLAVCVKSCSSTSSGHTYQVNVSGCNAILGSHKIAVLTTLIVLQGSDDVFLESRGPNTPS